MTDYSLQIGDRRVGYGHQPFIIAEMSGNHNQSIDRAFEIVEAAAVAGAHAIKLQTYTADTMTLDIREREFFIDDPDSLWHGKSLYELYELASTPWDWHKPIYEKARSLGMLVFSTPFDASAVDFLEELDSPCYKIASFENTDTALLRKVAATGKPVIMSTGMATLAELDESVRVLRESGCRDLVLLKCTSTYPASPENTNILTIPHMKTMFGCEVGLSDHTMGVGVAVGAVALGACMIEKHFTLRRADGGVDSAFSMEPDEMASLVRETERAWLSLGRVNYGPTEAEKPSMLFRRSLYITEYMKAGETLNNQNLKAIRPGYGLAPGYLEDVMGMTVNRDVQPGTPLSWDLVKKII